MKRRLAALFASMLVLSGCNGTTIYSNHTEAQELGLVRTLGIDKTENGVSVTATTGVGLNMTPPKLYRQEGATLSEALRNLSHSSMGRQMHFSHNESILVGEEAVCELLDCLDYVARVPDMRLVTDIYIVRGGTAEELITGAASESDDVTEMLSTLEREIQSTGKGYVYDCRHLLTDLEYTRCCKMMAIEGAKSEELSESSSELMIKPAGYAVTDGSKILGYVTGDAAVGASIMMESMRSHVMTLETEDGMGTVEINEYKISCLPEFKNNKLQKVTIEADVEAVLLQVGDGMNMLDDRARAKVEKAIAEKVLGCISSAVGVSKEMGADYMDIGWEIEMADPAAFRKWGKWYEEMGDTEFEIKTTARLIRSFDVEGSMEVWSGGDYNGR